MDESRVASAERATTAAPASVAVAATDEPSTAQSVTSTDEATSAIPNDWRGSSGWQEGAESPGEVLLSWDTDGLARAAKPASWYVGFGVAMSVAGVVVWFLTSGDLFATIIIVLSLLMLGIYTGLKPRSRTYALDGYGLTIGSHRYPYGDFRSFTVKAAGVVPTIELTPLKRLALYTVILFNASDEEEIVRILSDHLPMERPRNDLADILVHWLHF